MNGRIGEVNANIDGLDLKIRFVFNALDAGMPEYLNVIYIFTKFVWFTIQYNRKLFTIVNNKIYGNYEMSTHCKTIDLNSVHVTQDV